jgi:ribonuclease-3
MSRRFLLPEYSDSVSVSTKGDSNSGAIHTGTDRYSELEQQLGYEFQDKSWLERALTHRSAHAGQTHGNYERLEYIGDAVFDLAVAHLLSVKHENATEGELSKMRAALVNASSLAGIARRLSLGKFIKLSRSELANGANDRPSILADVLEALVGAIYFEAGFEVARECISRLLGDDILTVNPRDPKTELQELLHASGGTLPVYRIECTEGPEHSPIFVSAVEINGEIVGRGRGFTKKASQQMAAEEALLKFTHNRDSVAAPSGVHNVGEAGQTQEVGEAEGQDHDRT